MREDFKDKMRKFISDGLQYINDCDELFNYEEIQSGQVISYEGKHYLINLVYFQDIPSYEVLELDMQDIIIL